MLVLNLPFKALMFLTLMRPSLVLSLVLWLKLVKDFLKVRCRLALLPFLISCLYQNGRSLNELNRGQSGLETYGLFSNLTHDFLPISGRTASDSDSNPRSFKMSTRESLP